jgi:SpoVK/Ycf46/Vps4 family AAA+-type ATPase
MVGMQEVAGEIEDLVNLAADNQRREELGLPVQQTTNHLVFSGNPGTGKTTIAADVAKLYNALGILPTDKFMSIDKGAWVGEYANKIESNVTDVFRQAKGGVLFIDEAYTLADDEYGRRAANQIMKLMEENKDDTVVIIAGYPRQMQNLISINPGFASRFPRTIDFPDYSAKEQSQILGTMMQSNQDRVADPKTGKTLNSVISALAKKTPPENARGVRNLHDALIKARATRLAGQNATDKAISEFTSQDVKVAASKVGIVQVQKGKMVKQ